MRGSSVLACPIHFVTLASVGTERTSVFSAFTSAPWAVLMPAVAARFA
jgi:hypothetical protein